MDEANRTLMQDAATLGPELTAWRRHLHQNPELSFEEYETTAFLEKTLREWGLEPVRRTETGLWFDIEGPLPGRTVLVRADIDALPIREEAEVEHRSLRDGVMHACGHDGHTAIALGVTRLLLARRDEIRGRIRVLFQPAEEKLPGGAPMMIRAGVLEGVDVAIGLHLIPLGDPGLLTVGHVAIEQGRRMAAPDDFHIVVRGKGGHGASPHLAIDSITCAAAMINALQQVVSRMVDPLRPAVLTVGTFHAGFASNVIAPEAQMTGTVRTFDEATQERIETTMHRIVKDTADAFGATAELKYTRGYPVLVNSEEATLAFRETVRELLGDEALLPSEPVMGGEDFAYILQERPGAFLFLGCGSAELEAVYMNHHPKFSIDEAALPLGAAILTSTALRLLHA